MPRGWPESLRPPPILNLTMKDNLNPSSKSLHRTERPPPLLCQVIQQSQIHIDVAILVTWAEKKTLDCSPILQNI